MIYLFNITYISLLCEIKGMMVLAICVVHEIEYKFYFLDIAFMYIMYIALPTYYNWR